MKLLSALSLRSASPMKRLIAFVLVCALTGACVAAGSDDWPMWRHDARHTGLSPEALPDKLELQWSAAYPKLEHAWPDEDRMEFDHAYEPVVAGKTLYFGSSANDALVALDTDTGAERWRFYTDGPIRLAPAVAGGKVYFASDDGCLYCLDGASGALAWRFRAVPSERTLLGNTRLISAWPARGAPVVADGMVYFGAGIWSFEGIFLYALDAETGAVVWANDTCDVPYMQQPHHSDAFAGVTPQGYIAVDGDTLLVASGRAVAARLNRYTGEMVYFHIEPNNRHGGYRVAMMGDYFFSPSQMYEIETGRSLGSMGANVALAADTVFELSRGRVTAHDLSRVEVKRFTDNKNRIYWKCEMPRRWTLSCDATEIIVAGRRMYGCKPGEVFAVEIPKANDADGPDVVWRAEVDGTPRTLLAAEGKLFVSTDEGGIHCFGEGGGQPTTHGRAEREIAVSQGVVAMARSVLDTTGVTEGYCLVWGAEPADFLIALAQQSDLRIVAVEPDAEAVAAARRR
ncbi:MAG TPA: hypothetical protein ENN80_11385, partial [Candidatus Hydrogenedentes bacterium]|nr:hypothetical protein [Candidatus Hydrogenedentota bacterium]